MQCCIALYCIVICLGKRNKFAKLHSLEYTGNHTPLRRLWSFMLRTRMSFFPHLMKITGLSGIAWNQGKNWGLKKFRFDDKEFPSNVLFALHWSLPRNKIIWCEREILLFYVLECVMRLVVKHPKLFCKLSMLIILQSWSPVKLTLGTKKPVLLSRKTLEEDSRGYVGNLHP